MSLIFSCYSDWKSKIIFYLTQKFPPFSSTGIQSPKLFFQLYSNLKFAIIFLFESFSTKMNPQIFLQVEFKFTFYFYFWITNCWLWCSSNEKFLIYYYSNQKFYSLNLNQSNFYWLNQWFAFSLIHQLKIYFTVKSVDYH